MASGLYTSSREVKGRMQYFDHIVWRKAGVEEEPRLLDEVTDVGFLQVQYKYSESATPEAMTTPPARA